MALIGALASLPASTHAQTHIYPLNGTLADLNGGPSLVADGGLLTESGYAFGANQGLSLSNVFVRDQSYSLVLHSRFDGLGSADGYYKLVDFWDLASDHGLYGYFGSAIFDPYNYIQALDYPPGVMATTVITSDASDLSVRVYVDGALRYSITDGARYAGFYGTNGIARFFEDDAVTFNDEAGTGFVDYLATWDTVLSPAEVAQVSEPVVTPEPGSLALIVTGIVGIAAVARRRRVRAV